MQPVVVQGLPVTNEARGSSLDFYNSNPDVYSIKRASYNGKNIAYLLQGANGPCPLLAICNVLLLKGELSIADGRADIEFQTLIQQVANLLLERCKADDPAQQAVLNDTFGMLGKLNQGMDVNLKFTSVTGIERAKETGVFEILGIPVFHGWIVSEDDLTIYPYLSPLSYNEAVEKVAGYEEIKTKAVETGNFDLTEAKRDAIAEGEAIAKWLQATSSQMTSDGVIEINSAMKNGDLAVLFRNNHFSVIHKREDRLFGLVTDIGYGKTSIVWESIDQLDGDTLYLNASFLPVTSAGPESDYEMALRLQYSSSPVHVSVPAQNVAVVGQPAQRRTPHSNQCKCTIM
jgi:hypothetical protein